MSVFTPSGGAPAGATQEVEIAGVSSPTIINLSLPTAGTEYSQLIPLSVKKFMLRSRLSGRLQVAYISGQTNTTFLTISPGCTYTEEGLAATSPLTLYVNSSKPSDVLELILWE